MSGLMIVRRVPLTGGAPMRLSQTERARFDATGSSDDLSARVRSWSVAVFSAANESVASPRPLSGRLLAVDTRCTRQASGQPQAPGRRGFPATRQPAPWSSPTNALEAAVLEDVR